MEVRILEDHANPLLKRREYRFEVSHATAATPSRDDVRGELSKLVSAPKDRVVIERMRARYGTATTRGEALVYDSADAAKSITRAHILVRNGLKEKEAAPTPPASPPPAKPAEAPKAEAPAPAESKPEPKGEAKPEHKGEHKPEHKPEHKAEPKTEEKSEGHKPEHKAEHKGRAKSEKDEAPAKE